MTALNEKYPEAYRIMLKFYCNPTYYNSAPECRPADNVLMAIQYVLDTATPGALDPATVERCAQLEAFVAEYVRVWEAGTGTVYLIDAARNLTTDPHQHGGKGA